MLGKNRYHSGIFIQYHYGYPISKPFMARILPLLVSRVTKLIRGHKIWAITQAIWPDVSRSSAMHTQSCFTVAKRIRTVQRILYMGVFFFLHSSVYARTKISYVTYLSPTCAFILKKVQRGTLYSVIILMLVFVCVKCSELECQHLPTVEQLSYSVQQTSITCRALLEERVSKYWKL